LISEIESLFSVEFIYLILNLTSLLLRDPGLRQSVCANQLCDCSVTALEPLPPKSGVYGFGFSTQAPPPQSADELSTYLWRCAVEIALADRQSYTCRGHQSGLNFRYWVA